MIKSKLQLFLKGNEMATLKVGNDHTLVVHSEGGVESRVFAPFIIPSMNNINPSEYQNKIDLSVDAAKSVFGSDADLTVCTAEWDDGKWGVAVGLHGTFSEQYSE